MLDRNDNREAMQSFIMAHQKKRFIRKAAGTSNDEQVVAANIDTVFICMLNNDFNLRMERYLGIME